jgi:hypothetical protein
LPASSSSTMSSRWGQQPSMCAIIRLGSSSMRKQQHVCNACAACAHINMRQLPVASLTPVQAWHGMAWQHQPPCLLACT